MSFVRTPAGVLMHVDNHRALVEMAKRVGSRGMLAMLEPAEPVRPFEGFNYTWCGIDAPRPPLTGRQRTRRLWRRRGRR